MDPIKCVLATPVKKGDVEIKEIVFARRIKAKDFSGMSSDLDQDANMLLISRLSGVELHLIEELDGYDYGKLGEILLLFLGSGPVSGKPSSGK